MRQLAWCMQILQHVIKQDRQRCSKTTMYQYEVNQSIKISNNQLANSN